MNDRDAFIGREDDANEAVKNIINDAVVRKDPIVGIIEEDGVRGLYAAEWAVIREKWKGASFSLVYGVQITTCTNVSNPDLESKSVILIPRNHNGFRNICELLTHAYSKCSNTEKPVVSYEQIEKYGSGLLCLDSTHEKNNSFSKYGLKVIADYTSEESILLDYRSLPQIENSEKDIKRDCINKAQLLYGEHLPERVESRLETELASIINNGYSSKFALSQKLSEKARKDGFPMGFQGYIGSSLVAFLLGITEINPLPPHYICPNCSHYEEPKNEFQYESGWDLSKKNCPVCGTEMIRDGYRIPCEVLFGFRMDREPDIDLSFAPEYKAEILKALSDLFGEERVVCGGRALQNGEIGKHPERVFIVPEDKEIYDYSPLVKPKDDNDDMLVTQVDCYDFLIPLSEFDYPEHESLHHLKKLWELTGINPKDIPMDDDETISYIANSKGAYPEPKRDNESYTNDFETELGKYIINTVNPKSFSELVRISALIHGVDAWEENAEVLIEEGIADIKEVITTRDDIMNYLLSHGMDEYEASVIMDRVRKGRELTDEMIKEMKEYRVPDWYIESCNQLKYVFPRAHVVHYVMMYLRMIWYKIHYPAEYEKVICMQN